MAQLILKSDVFPDGRMVITDTELPKTIGRSHQADICIPDLLLSRLHAELRTGPDGRFQIVDSESTNLTIVNDQDIQCAELRTGDRILLGETELLVEIEHERTNINDKTTRELPVIRTSPQ